MFWLYLIIVLNFKAQNLGVVRTTAFVRITVRVQSKLCSYFDSVRQKGREGSDFKSCRWKVRKWAIFLFFKFSKNIWKNMSKNMVQTGSKFFYRNMKSTFFVKRYLTGVERSDQCKYRLYPLTLCTDNSNVIDNLRGYSQRRITMPNMQTSFQIVDDTARIDFLQKLVTVLYFEAQLEYILKSFIYSLPGMADFKMTFTKVAV